MNLLSDKESLSGLSPPAIRNVCPAIVKRKLTQESSYSSYDSSYNSYSELPSRKISLPAIRNVCQAIAKRELTQESSYNSNDSSNNSDSELPSRKISPPIYLRRPKSPLFTESIVLGSLSTLRSLSSGSLNFDDSSKQLNKQPTQVRQESPSPEYKKRPVSLQNAWCIPILDPHLRSCSCPSSLNLKIFHTQYIDKDTSRIVPECDDVIIGEVNYGTSFTWLRQNN
jgi:hypothetical protein